MIVEYKVKFDKDGLSITERIQSGATTAPVKPNAPTLQKSLPGSFEEFQSPAARDNSGGGGDEKDTGGNRNGKGTGRGGDEKDTGGGGDSLSTGPVTFIGPFIFVCPPEGMSLPSPAAVNKPEVKNGN